MDPQQAAVISTLQATEALKWMTSLGMDAQAIAHRVAAIMTGKKAHPSAPKIVPRALVSGALRLVCAMPDDMAKIEAQVAKSAHAEVEEKLAVVADVARSLGPAAFIKLIPTHQDLHRHVAVLLPEYDSSYVYTRGDTSSSLKGPGGLKWKTRRSSDDDNDPRFPDFW